MAHIPVGTTGEQKTRVTRELTISFMGVEDARVLSTPEMIRWMERTCRDTVLPLLEPGHDTVGTQVNVYHRSAAPLDSEVTFRAEVLEVADRRIRFYVEALSGTGKIGDGTHERAIVNVEKFAARQAEKKRANFS